MADKLFPAGRREQRPHITALQHESAVKRWPIRHAAEQNFDWSLRASYGVSLADVAVSAATQTPNYQAIGSNVVQLDEKRDETTTATKDKDVLDLYEAQSEAPVYDFDAIKQAVSDPAIHEGELDIDAIREEVQRHAA